MGSIGPPLRTALDQIRVDLLATLSAQVDGLAAHAVRRAGRAGDPRWWTAALDGPARTLDDAWARRSGPVLRRRAAATALRHQGVRVTQITHGASQSGGRALTAAAARVRAVRSARDRALARRVRDAVLAAADRELAAWIAAAERWSTGPAVPRRASHRPAEPARAH